MAFSKPVLEFWAKPYYPLVPALGGAALAVVQSGGLRRAKTATGKAKVAKFALAGTVLGVAVMLYSRKALGQPALGSYGFASNALVDAASKQIDYAKSGRRLTDYRSASPPGDAWKTPTDAQEANYRAAYWLAVAAQIEGDTSWTGLLGRARAFYTAGKVGQGGGIYSPDFVIKGLTDNAADYVAANTKTANGRAIASILKGDYARIAAAKETKSDTTRSGQTVNFVKGATTDFWSLPGSAATRASLALEPVGELLRAAGGLGPAGTGADPGLGDKKERPLWFWPAIVGGGVLTLATLVFILSTPRSAPRPTALAA